MSDETAVASSSLPSIPCEKHLDSIALHKVFGALLDSGLNGEEAKDAIAAMEKAGIGFVKLC
jgi:hypothetical protein